MLTRLRMYTFFFFNDTATTEIYTLSLHDALPISTRGYTLRVGEGQHMPTQIKFGTSGWRAGMAEEFTFANVRRVVSGISHYVGAQKPSGARVIVGRDPRVLGETFWSFAAEIFSAHGRPPRVLVH